MEELLHQLYMVISLSHFSTRFYTSQVVQEFFHQQYHGKYMEIHRNNIQHRQHGQTYFWTYYITICTPTTCLVHPNVHLQTSSTNYEKNNPPANSPCWPKVVQLCRGNWYGPKDHWTLETGVILRTLPLRNTGSFTLPLEGPRSLGGDKKSIKSHNFGSESTTIAIAPCCASPPPSTDQRPLWSSVTSSWMEIWCKMEGIWSFSRISPRKHLKYQNMNP